MLIDGIIKGVLSPVLETVDRLIPDKTQAQTLKAEITMQAMNQDYTALDNEINARAKIITSETQGASWLQRNWRPVLMLTFTYLIAHNYIIAPMIRMFNPAMPMLTIPPDMWDLLKLGIGGYIVGRSGEKIVATMKGQKPQ